MTLRFYNTATRKKEPFQPIHPGKVDIYVCGVTVYDFCHIGHARSTIVFDVLVRYLRARGFDVTYIRNFTDVDDKIIDRANKLGKDTAELAQEFIDAFYDDMGKLRVLKADHEPRATEHISGMIEMIMTLLDKGFAYQVDDNVFFSVEKFKNYGELSRRRLEDMKAGSRIAIDERKNHPMDFVLWKGAKEGEPQWPSPWGPGRPGWHMECSVMSSHFLGPTFDIHGGGEDLLFPHHENERAQSMTANGEPFARYWIHNGFVTVEAEKMSKSLGNFLTIRDALKMYHPEVLRLFLLSKQYRSPIDFSKKAILGLQSGLVRIYRTLQRIENVLGAYGGKDERDAAGKITVKPEHDFLEQFINVMNDDLNTAGAIGLIFEKIREINKLMDSQNDRPDEPSLRRLENDRYQLFEAAGVLGMLEETPENFFKQISEASQHIEPAEIEKLIEERSAAREGKDWAGADQIRDRLKEMGVAIEDGPEGTSWRFEV
ncbi:cysteine--tRNA ligase [Thermodesulfobacteriota bacterium]